jgi:hypothetical protein
MAGRDRLGCAVHRGGGLVKLLVLVVLEVASWVAVISLWPKATRVIAWLNRED